MRQHYWNKLGTLIIAGAIWIIPSVFLTVLANADRGVITPIIVYLLLEEDSDQCTRDAAMGESINGVLLPQCVVDELSEKYYTRFYTFSLTDAATVVIDVEPTTDSGYQPHVVLRQGAGVDGDELFFADKLEDVNRWVIEAELETDDFTIEISSVNQQVLDSFTLSVGQIAR